MEGQLRELIPFLRDKNPQVRQIALENLVPQTQKGAPHRDIFLAGLQSGGLKQPKESDIIRDLKLLCRDQLSVAHDAFRALVNLSDSSLLTPFLTEPSFIQFIVSYIINPQSILADLASMLLSNLTASSVACSALLELKVKIMLVSNFPNGYYPTQSRCGSCAAPVPYPTGDSRDVLSLPLLVDAFVQGAQFSESDDPEKRLRKGNLHFLASVFANLTMSPMGRTFFLTPFSSEVSDQPAEYPLSKLVSFTEHKDVIRRGGVASTIKNCCFHTPGHRAMLSPETVQIAISNAKPAPGVDVLPHLLLPLAGPEELDFEDQEKLPEQLQFLPPTKIREVDTVIRLTHVETLLLLCHTRWGRDYQRDHGVYEIIRGTHESESVERISEHIERLVVLLKGTEPGQVLEDEEADGTVTQPAAHDTNLDDEDNRIEEV
ncbi:DUF383-domain-containing protein [Pluteus cervinus]|uniref:DUF383-domain-containing protein n=1 Tax=Pluteus cervinus TaxID=181527 RepID=A0ACD3AU86_9AGAR|nr:DUF383-domain-containing protein [Pluteus cervinus]